jgi:hypothetical protein
MTGIGTNRTSSHVRSMVAIGGKADMGWTALSVAIDPQRKSQGASSSSACEGTAMAIRLARELRTMIPSGTLAWRLGLWLFRGKRPGRIALGSADT